MTATTILGWIGAVAFSICGVPQAYLCYKNKNADGMSLSYLMLWLMGELCTISYVFPKGDMPMIFNYSLNLIVLLVILRYKLLPVKRKIKI